MSTWCEAPVCSILYPFLTPSSAPCVCLLSYGWYSVPCELWTHIFSVSPETSTVHWLIHLMDCLESGVKHVHTHEHTKTISWQDSTDVRNPLFFSSALGKFVVLPALQTEPQKEPILNKLKCGISMCLPRQCCIDVPLLICLPATDHKPEFKKDCAYCI